MLHQVRVPPVRLEWTGLDSRCLDPQLCVSVSFCIACSCVQCSQQQQQQQQTLGASMHRQRLRIPRIENCPLRPPAAIIDNKTLTIAIHTSWTDTECLARGKWNLEAMYLSRHISGPSSIARCRSGQQLDPAMVFGVVSAEGLGGIRRQNHVSLGLPMS